MMLKLKLPYFGHLMRRVDSLEKTLMLEVHLGVVAEIPVKYRKLDNNPSFVISYPCKSLQDTELIWASDSTSEK